MEVYAMASEEARQRRIRAESRTLPRVNPFVVDAMMEMLMADSGATKPPEQAATLLALLVELDKLGEPIPTREVMAQVLGGSKSKYTVDAIVSSKIEDGYLQLVVETTHGNVSNRSSSRKQKYLVPSKRVKSVAQRAESLGLSP
jgi:hypothetical protein